MLQRRYNWTVPACIMFVTSTPEYLSWVDSAQSTEMRGFYTRWRILFIFTDAHSTKQTCRILSILASTPKQTNGYKIFIVRPTVPYGNGFEFCRILSFSLYTQNCHNFCFFFYKTLQKYKSEGHPTIVLAGAEYGSGSSRDWAAKGPMLLVSFSLNLWYSLLIFIVWWLFS